MCYSSLVGGLWRTWRQIGGPLCGVADLGRATNQPAADGDLLRHPPLQPSRAPCNQRLGLHRRNTEGQLYMMASPAVAAGVLGSRQKNCNSCVQTKRRCDRRTPVCSRCAEKKIPCAYGKARVSNHTGNQDTRPNPDTEVLQLGSPSLSLFESVPPFDVGCFHSLAVNSSSDVPGPALQSVPSAFVDEDISMDSFMDFVHNDDPSIPDRWLVPVDDNIVIERPGTPADEEITNSYQKMAPFCVSQGQMLFFMREYV